MVWLSTESAFSPDEWAKRKGQQGGLIPTQPSDDAISRAETTNEEDLLLDNIPRSTSEEGLCARVDLNHKNKYQLSVDVAIHLISFVYETKFAQIIEDIDNMEFNKIRPFLEYVKEVSKGVISCGSLIMTIPYYTIWLICRGE